MSKRKLALIGISALGAAVAILALFWAADDDARHEVRDRNGLHPRYGSLGVGYHRRTFFPPA